VNKIFFLELVDSTSYVLHKSWSWILSLATSE